MTTRSISSSTDTRGQYEVHQQGLGSLGAVTAAVVVTALPAHAQAVYAPYAQAGAVIDAEGAIVISKKIVGVTKPPAGHIFCVEVARTST